jgi:hypothetical protein
VGARRGLADCLTMVTLDSTDPALAVAAPADVLWGMKADIRTFTREPARTNAGAG